MRETMSSARKFTSTDKLRDSTNSFKINRICVKHNLGEDETKMRSTFSTPRKFIRTNYVVDRSVNLLKVPQL